MEVPDGPVTLDNAKIARVFDDISRLLEVKQDSPFKIRAYRNAADAIRAHPEELRDVVARGDDLRGIAGIGDAIAKKIVELLSTGRLAFYEKLIESAPSGVLELMQVPGIGPRTAGRLASELGISSIRELEVALVSGAVAQLPGMGDKTARTLLRELEVLQSSEEPDVPGVQ